MLRCLNPRGGAFKEGALRGPAQPPSSHANTQRQGATCGVLESKGTFWVQNVPFESKTKTPRFESYPGNRTKNRTSNRGAHAQECCTQCSTTCPPDVCLTLLARTRYRFCPLLRCAGHSWPSDQRQETGHANKCSASQPPASRRSIGTRWPEEGSALEMAHSDANRSHAKGHA